MRYWILGLGFFAFLVATLFTARFQIVPTPAQYAFAVVWSGLLSWSLVVIVRRMARPQAPARRVRG